MNNNLYLLIVPVFDLARISVTTANVAVYPVADPNAKASLAFNPDWDAFVLGMEVTGRFVIEVSGDGLETQQREVELSPDRNNHPFYLAPPAQTHYHLGGIKVPYTQMPEWLVLQFVEGLTDERREQIAEDWASDLNVRIFSNDELLQLNAGVAVKLNGEPTVERVNALIQSASALPEIRRAGQVVYRKDDAIHFLTDNIIVKFKHTTFEEDIRALAVDVGLTIERSLPYSKNAWLFKASEGPVYKVLDTVNALQELEEVLWAEPNLSSFEGMDGIPPSDFLYPMQWSKDQVGLPAAWQACEDAGLHPFGNPDITIAIIDKLVQPAHPELNVNLSDGTPKVVDHRNFRDLPNWSSRAVNPNFVPFEGHGMGAAGIATAAAENIDPLTGQAIGIVGAAPNCSMISLYPGTTQIRRADMLVWAIGEQTNNTEISFNVAKPVDVFSCSLGFGNGVPLAGIADDVLEFVTTIGRQGRGCPMFFSTGNGGNNISNVRSWASHFRTSAVVGTSRNGNGQDTFPTYSGFGPVEIAAPGGSGSGGHNPPGTYSPITLKLLGEPSGLPGVPTVSTTLTAEVLPDDRRIQMDDTNGVQVGHGILFRSPANNNFEVNIVKRVRGNEIQLNTKMTGAHPVGTPISIGPSGYQMRYIGTSAATPLAAGCAAIALSFDPTLTWTQLRELFRETAVKFDSNVINWVDRQGRSTTVQSEKHFSQRLGHGRIDIGAALQYLSNNSDRADLIIRANLSDDGDVPRAAPFHRSPDIWVRNNPPSSDPAALPADYQTAGAHQTPIAGTTNWLYGRVKNRGQVRSSEGWVRFFVTHWPSAPLTYPEYFIPSSPVQNDLSVPRADRVFFLGQVYLSPLAAGEERIVHIPWDEALVPPEFILVNGSQVSFHPCLLMEVSPQTGTIAGPAVWQNSNIGQYNSSIIYPGSTGDGTGVFAFGSPLQVDPSADINYRILEVNANAFDPATGIRLLVDFEDQRLANAVARQYHPNGALRSNVTLPGLNSAKTDRANRTTRGNSEVIEIIASGRVQIPIPFPTQAIALVKLIAVLPSPMNPQSINLDVYELDSNGNLLGANNFDVRMR